MTSSSPGEHPSPTTNFTSNETSKLDVTKKKLTEEFMKKLSQNSSPNTLPKPQVTPRRSSLHFANNFNSVKVCFLCQITFMHRMNFQEVQYNSRKSIGDVFGSRMTPRHSQPVPDTRGSGDSSRASSGIAEKSPDEVANKFKDILSKKESFPRSPLKQTFSPDHPSLIRSATLVEVMKYLYFNLIGLRCLF